MLNDTNDTIEDIPEAWLTELTRLKVLSVRENLGLRKSDPIIRRMNFEICVPNGGAVLVDG